jgi:hypothetical protein
MKAGTAAIPVTVDNFIRAETDMYLARFGKEGFGRLHHNRSLCDLDHQIVVRDNRDVLMSYSVLDLDAGPATITLPDAGTRFRSLQAIDQNHFTPVIGFDAGDYTFTKDKIGTRYLALALRTLVDPNNPQDVQAVHALQDATKISQPGGPGRLEIPSWDPESQNRVRDALLVLASTIGEYKGAFGTREEVDPVRHLIGTAMGWGGNPETVAIYLNVTPPKNDGTTVHRLSVKDVPVDGFWSITAYNDKGYFDKNPYDAYNFNNITTKKSQDGSIAIQFGGCDGKIPNCLPIMKGWNYIVRLYRPRTEIRNGTWKFPEPQPVN